MGQVYSVRFEQVSVSVAQALFTIGAPANVRLRLREVRVGQTSDVGDAASEILSVRLIRNATALATEGGHVVVPQNLQPWARASVATVKANVTAFATAGGKCLLADTMNIAAGWWYYPPDCEKIWIADSGNLQICISAPADALTMNGTAIFEEMSRPVE